MPADSAVRACASPGKLTNMSSLNPDATAVANWHSRAAALKPDGRAFVAGHRVAALSGATFDKRSPIDGRWLAAPDRAG